jgi:hypothetical protein
MRSLVDDSTSTAFCVVVHDVTPQFPDEIEQVLSELQPMISNRFVGAIVPRWHGRRVDASARRQFARWSESFGDVVLHGWTHHRNSNRGLVSRCTDDADEFGRRSIADTVERLRWAQLDSQELLGREVPGFVPPAWCLAAKIEDLHPAGIEYLMRFHRLEPRRGSSISLATCSWDWGWLPGIHVLCSALGRWLETMNPQAVPVIAIHPMDVRRGRLPTAVHLIQRLLSSGRLPMLPCELLSENRLVAAL